MLYQLSYVGERLRLAVPALPGGLAKACVKCSPWYVRSARSCLRGFAIAHKSAAGTLGSHARWRPWGVLRAGRAGTTSPAFRGDAISVAAAAVAVSPAAPVAVRTGAPVARHTCTRSALRHRRTSESVILKLRLLLLLLLFLLLLALLGRLDLRLGRHAAGTVFRGGGRRLSIGIRLPLAPLVPRFLGVALRFA